MSLQQKEKKTQRNRRVEGAANMAVFLVKSCDKLSFFSGPQEKARDKVFMVSPLSIPIHIPKVKNGNFVPAVSHSLPRPSITHSSLVPWSSLVLNLLDLS